LFKPFRTFWKNQRAEIRKSRKRAKLIQIKRYILRNTKAFNLAFIISLITGGNLYILYGLALKFWLGRGFFGWFLIGVFPKYLHKGPFFLGLFLGLIWGKRGVIAVILKVELFQISLYSREL